MIGGVVISGRPTQQGSKKPGPVRFKDGRPHSTMLDDNGPALKKWRSAGQEAIRTAYPRLTVAAPIFVRHAPVAVAVRAVFELRGEDLAAIRREEKQGHGEHPCQPGCVHLPWHTVTPDKDKVLRAVFDLLTQAHVWHDDGQCARFEVLAYRGPAPLTAIRWAAM